MPASFQNCEMIDKEFWKKKYGHSWKNAKRRVEKVIEALESEGIDVEESGFLARSTEYSKKSPKERGAPDLKVSSVEVYIEVTGPDKAISATNDLWIRWDKFIYAENHPEKEIWVIHILESEDDLMKALKLGRGVKERYSLIHPLIRGTRETYRSIPANDSNLFSFDNFCSALLEASSNSNLNSSSTLSF